MLLFRKNESSQNGSQVVLPRIVVSNHFCSLGQMTSFNAILDLTLRPSVNLRAFVPTSAILYVYLGESLQISAINCVSWRLHNRTELNRSASTKTAAAREERKTQEEINQLLQVLSTNHLVARFRVVNIYVSPTL